MRTGVGRTGHRRDRLGRVLLVLASCLAPIGIGAALPTAPAAAATPVVGSPASLVNVFAGTGAGPVAPGTIGEFPAADLPFGMIQWGPDTSPDRANGSGYSYGDHQISGLSLTHMSGTGCASYGDVPILPVAGPIGSDPGATTAPFRHQDESGSPGRYQVALGSPAVDARLAVTARTGIARFTYPASPEASVLFKASDSAAGVQGASVQIAAPDLVTGQVTSGGFCGTGTSYTLYFAARFDRAFAAEGTWTAAGVRPGTLSCSNDGCGAYITFAPGSGRTVTMKVGISFVSVAGAEANLAVEDAGWSLPSVAAAGTARWNALLGRIAVGGGTLDERRTFTTALYHSLLHPNLVSDASGAYTGEDGRVHQSAEGQYANFSEWDIYRSEIQLISLVAPGPAGAMVQSLVNDAQQDGWLPKWAIADGDAAQMNGDSADPIIASAYAFGVRGFDARAALAAMVKGATEQESPHGLEIERQDLDQYLSQHYLPADVRDLDSIDYTAGSSMTLEYAIDDFAIAQLAGALGDSSLSTTMMARAHNWEYLFNPSTGFLQGRTASGAFPPGPAFDRALLEPGGENGFEEGNAVQYTWSVPEDLAGLAALMGGDQAAVATLDRFFTRLNAGRDAPYDWAGNEPNLWTPWEYDAFGAPSHTQAVVRRIMTTLYGDGPVDEPGNDDLGAISSWYVWAALGLYPLTPGTATLAVAAPLFPSARITLGNGKHLTLLAPQASAGTPYIHSVRVQGISLPGATAACAPIPGRTAASDAATDQSTTNWDRPWLPGSVLTSGGTITSSLSPAPDPMWGTSPSDAPPSYASGRIPALGSTRPSGALSVTVGRRHVVQLGLQDLAERGPAVSWHATASAGLTVSPSSGTFPAPVATATAGGTAGTCAPPPPSTASLRVTASAPGTGSVTISFLTTGGTTLPPVVLQVTAG